MGSPFTNPIAPGAPDPAPRPRDLEGCLVAYSPTGFTAAGAEGNTTGVGTSEPRDRVTTDLLILDVPRVPRGAHQPTPGVVAFGGSPDWDQKPTPHYLQVAAPARFEGAWVSNGNIVRALAPGRQPLVGQMVLGRIVRSDVGQRPFNLVAVAGTPDEQLALQIWQQINTVNPQTGQPMLALNTAQPIPGAPVPQRTTPGAGANAAPMPPANSVSYAPVPQPPVDPGVAAVQAQFPGAQVVPNTSPLPMPPVPQPPMPVPTPPAAPAFPAHLAAVGWTPESWATLTSAQQSQVLANTPF